MAKLHIISSSSGGNAYILECDGYKLIIELGCSWDKILRELDYELRPVCGVLVSHSHADHAQSISDALGFGLPVYSCQEVQSIHPEVEVLKKGVKTRINNIFVVQPIPLKHNVENYGYLITHPSLGKLVFATDCASFPYKMKNINHFVIEANYSRDLVVENLYKGMESRSMSGNHLEINDTIDALKRNYTPNLQTVVLIHLSNGNSNAQEFQRKVQEELGFANVYIADNGATIDLDQDEF